MDDYREVVCHDTAEQFAKTKADRKRQDDTQAWREEMRIRNAGRKRSRFGEDSRL